MPLRSRQNCASSSAADFVQAGPYLLEPYQRGKMPVVLVHGTEASSPARGPSY